MKQKFGRTVAILALGALLLGCSEASAKDTKTSPSKVEPIPGANVSKVTLLESAAKRIGLQTGALREVDAGLRGETGPRKVVPYSAIIYDLTGTAWVYTNLEPLAFVRQRVVIDYVQGDSVVLFDGPAVGTQVVTVGAAELYGAETGVGR